MPVLILIIVVVFGCAIFADGPFANPLALGLTVLFVGSLALYLWAGHEEEKDNKNYEENKAKRTAELQTTVKSRREQIMDARKRNPYAYMSWYQMMLWKELHENHVKVEDARAFLKKYEDSDRASYRSMLGLNASLNDTSNYIIHGLTRDDLEKRFRDRKFYKQYCRDYDVWMHWMPDMKLIFDCYCKRAWCQEVGCIDKDLNYVNIFEDITKFIPPWNVPQSLDELQGEDKFKKGDRDIYFDYEPFNYTRWEGDDMTW